MVRRVVSGVSARVLRDATLLKPSPTDRVGYVIAGGRLVMLVPRARYDYLRRDLGAEKLYVVYEDKTGYVIAGVKGNTVVGVTKVPKSFFESVRRLTRFIPRM